SHEPSLRAHVLGYLSAFHAKRTTRRLHRSFRPRMRAGRRRLTESSRFQVGPSCAPHATWPPIGRCRLPCRRAQQRRTLVLPCPWPHRAPCPEHRVEPPPVLLVASFEMGT